MSTLHIAGISPSIEGIACTRKAPSIGVVSPLFACVAQRADVVEFARAGSRYSVAGSCTRGVAETF